MQSKNRLELGEGRTNKGHMGTRRARRFARALAIVLFSSLLAFDTLAAPTMAFAETSDDI